MHSSADTSNLTGRARANGLTSSDSLFGNAALGTDSSPDVVAIKEQIQMLLAEKLAPVELGGRLRDMVTSNPRASVLAIVEILSTECVRDAQDLLARQLMASGLLLDLICGGAFSSLENAVKVTRLVAHAEPMLNVVLLKSVWTDRELLANRIAVLRVLSVAERLEALSRALPLLVQMARSSGDHFIRSKATLLAAKAQADGRLVIEQLKDQSPRVRANAVEALWGQRTKAAIQVFEAAAAKAGEHHRVAVNALVGLYLAGRQDEAIRLLKKLSLAHSSGMQTAAAWAMGYLQDPCFLEDLAQPSDSTDSSLARMAALAKLNIPS